MEEATREEDRSRFGKLFEANTLFAIQGAENCFKDVTTNNEDKIGIIRWYVRSSKLLAKKELKVSFARVLNANSEGSHKAVAYRIAEEYYDELKEVYEGHPELDFLMNGITEYQNVADFARAAGYEIEEIFPEKSPIAEGQGGKAAGVRGFRDISSDKKHALDVLNSLNELQHLVGGSDTLIINFKKKDDEKKVSVLQRLISPFWTIEQMEQNLAFTDALLHQIPIWHLYCNMEEEAAICMKQEIDSYLSKIKES
jgi:hypothetical protein